eukprot:CAMPEP_0171512934 /NCGR_PEP_ID=MMETSP0959-20130129/1907_1 /TAXON_ID=87120 /ORGANISM="Aurantiochytrium limacinum, Strain ATCCMYA-1381" /LENGTH=361 /DNA_ID=CAMNT_0012050889 /DNA_START=602 /DNA_END=1687 /DNA_ORIENTATION=+
MTEENVITMKAAVGKGYGPIDEMVEVVDNIAKPKEARPGYLIVRVLACALAPGDLRVLSGRTKMVQGPPSFPYVIGGDVCGIVDSLGEDVEGFEIGDCVVARFHTAGPRGGIAEYYEVKSSLTEHKPSNLEPAQASALASSGTSALIAVNNAIRPGDRVLVLGGSGGVGTILLQLAAMKKPSFLAVTTSNVPLVNSLGVADLVLDYNQENWWEVAEVTDKAPFDVIVDLGQGISAWNLAVKYKLLKPNAQGGRYHSFVGDDPILWAQGIFQILRCMGPALWRNFWTPYFSNWPSYKWQLDGLPDKREPLTELFKIVESQNLNIVLSENSPFPFTTEGVRAAMNLLQTRHAHGKVIVHVADF